jgi:MFS family permease
MDEPARQTYRVYPYRWVVLAATMGVNLTIQMLWISYAPITDDATRYYGVSTLAIGLLSMVFMIAFIPLSLPASWLIDRRGFRVAVGFGSVLMGVSGIVRGLAGDDYTLALLSTIAIACAQPFLMNAWTTVPAKWFPETERATAVGLVTLASLVGTGVGMALTPVLASSTSIASIQLLYGGLAAAAAAAFLLLAREQPATPPSAPGAAVRALVLDGLKHALTVRPFLLYLAVIFVGMGIFNGVTTWVEEIVRPRGFSSTDAGTTGALMLLGGIIGALTMSAVSDRQGKRVRYITLGLALAIPGLLGLAFAQSAWLLFGSAFLLGFFLVSTSPIGMQFAAEVAYPTPEGTSNGLVQLVGQVAVVFVFAMEALRTSSGSFAPSLLLAAVMLGVVALVFSRLRDPAPAAGGAG